MWSGTHHYLIETERCVTQMFEEPVMIEILTVYKGGYEVEVAVSVFCLSMGTLFRRYWKCHETQTLTSRDTHASPMGVPWRHYDPIENSWEVPMDVA